MFAEYKAKLLNFLLNFPGMDYKSDNSKTITSKKQILNSTINIKRYCTFDH